MVAPVSHTRGKIKRRPSGAVIAVGNAIIRHLDVDYLVLFANLTDLRKTKPVVSH